MKYMVFISDEQALPDIIDSGICKEFISEDTAMEFLHCMQGYGFNTVLVEMQIRESEA